MRGPEPHFLLTENDLRHHQARICVLALAALPLFGQYGGFGGPSILSRSNGPSGRTGSNPVAFRPFAGVSGNYSTNMNRQDNSSGTATLGYRDTLGVTGSVGLQGYKTNERTSTSVDLSLSYFWTKVSAVSRGLAESVNITHSRQLSRRVSWYLGASVQSNNRSIGFANSRYSPEPLPELTPQSDEIFDSRITRGNFGTGVTFQKSARLSFSAQVGAFGAERSQKTLADSRGFMGQASMQYSLSRRQYVGASFAYGTFYFPGTYGETRYYSPQAFYGVNLNREWNLNFAAGIFQAHTDRLIRVQLDPFIAQLTGQSSVLEIYSGDNRGFSGEVSLNGNYRRWGISLAGRRGLMPGNGIYLTSQMTQVNLNVSHTLGRSASFAVYARGAEMKALTQSIRNGRYYSGGTSFTYRLTDYLSFASSVGYFKTQAAGQRIEYNRLGAMAGIYLAPGELPLQIF